MQQSNQAEMADIHGRHYYNLNNFKNRFLSVSEWRIEVKHTGKEVTKIKSGEEVNYFSSSLIDTFVTSGLLWKVMGSGSLVGIYDSKTGLIWNIDFASQVINAHRAKEIADSIRNSSLKWQLSNKNETAGFLTDRDNRYVTSGDFFHDLTYGGE